MAMTTTKALCRRVIELDRLYLEADRCQSAYLLALQARDLDAVRAAEAERDRYRQAYIQLRDSPYGLPDAKVGAGV